MYVGLALLHFLVFLILFQVFCKIQKSCSCHKTNDQLLLTCCFLKNFLENRLLEMTGTASFPPLGQ